MVQYWLRLSLSSKVWTNLPVQILLCSKAEQTFNLCFKSWFCRWCSAIWSLYTGQGGAPANLSSTVFASVIVSSAPAGNTDTQWLANTVHHSDSDCQVGMSLPHNFAMYIFARLYVPLSKKYGACWVAVNTRITIQYWYFFFYIQGGIKESRVHILICICTYYSPYMQACLIICAYYWYSFVCFARIADNKVTDHFCMSSVRFCTFYWSNLRIYLCSFASITDCITTIATQFCL